MQHTYFIILWDFVDETVSAEISEREAGLRHSEKTVLDTIRANPLDDTNYYNKLQTRKS